MAKHQKDWEPDTEDGPATYPKTRDELVQSNRNRRTDEPAAAPQETDSESGSPSAVPLTARMEPARTHLVNAAESGQHDVRAGPGDAGASDSPMYTPKRVEGRSDGWRKVAGIIATVVLIGVIASLAMGGWG